MRFYLNKKMMSSELEKLLAEIKNGNNPIINLQSNNIGKGGAIALSDMLIYNTTVQEIYLGYNNIGDEGAIAIANTLRYNITVEKIDLTSNNIGKDGAIALADMLRYNFSIREIHLGGNNIGRVNKQILKRVMIDNPYIRKRLLSNYEATIFKKIFKYGKISQRIAIDISQVYCLCKINKEIYI